MTTVKMAYDDSQVILCYIDPQKLACVQKNATFLLLLLVLGNA